MRIDEITRPASMMDAMERLESSGYVRIGIGHFGCVYQRPGSNQVIKLYRSVDSNYSRFIGMAKMSRSEHFPRFIGDIIRVTDQYNAIRMERLDPMDGSYDRKVKICLALMAGISGFSAGMDESDIVDAMDSESYGLVALQPGLLRALEELSMWFPRPDLFNVDNVMLRDSTIVITDP